MVYPPDENHSRPGIGERLARLIQVETVSSVVAERGTGEFEAVLAELYPLVHERLTKETIGERGLLFTWRGATDASPLVLMAHFDTVPAVAAEWSRPPFSGAIENGIAHGRGAADDKGALVTIFDAVENLLAVGTVPDRTVYLSLGGDEETYGSSAREISDELERRGIRPWLVIDEGGAVIDAPLPGLNHQTAMIGVAEKGVLTVRLTATAAADAASHASTPSRAATAPERIARAITRLRRNPFRKRFGPTARAMFAAYDGVATGAGKALVTLAPRLAPVTARLLSLLGGEPAAMVQTTVAVTIVEAGTAQNVIPTTASATLNLRLAVGDSVDSVLATLRRAVRDLGIAFEVLEAHAASPESRIDSEQWQTIADAVTAAYPGTVVAPYVMLAASDARHFHRYTPEATYRFAPLRMSRAERAAIHGVDEQITVDALKCGERFYRHLIARSAQT
jgi:carboxypeptidase PM20D1